EAIGVQEALLKSRLAGLSHDSNPQTGYNRDSFRIRLDLGWTESRLAELLLFEAVGLAKDEAKPSEARQQELAEARRQKLAEALVHATRAQELLEQCSKEEKENRDVFQTLPLSKVLKEIATLDDKASGLASSAQDDLIGDAVVTGKIKLEKEELFTLAL